MNLPSWDHAATVYREQLLSSLGADELSGLSEEVVIARRREFGLNELKVKKVHWWTILFRQFCSSFVYLLLAAAAVAEVMREWTDALVILAFLIFNAALGFVQEFRAERSLDLLKTFITKEARVRRAGTVARVPVAQIVPGDVVLLDAGDMIPADGVFLLCDNVRVDESALTGESIAVVKIAEPLPATPKSFAEAKNIGFFRTSVLSGKAELLVIATGVRTQVGTITKTVAEEDRPSAFEEGIAKFSGFILRLVLATIPLIFVLHFIIHRGAIDIGDFLLFTIALTVSVIPEALPLVSTISISRGALRLAKKDVVPRRLSAVEDLGSIEVLCTDKTGTITENKLVVAEIFGETDTLYFASVAPASAPDEASAQNGVYDAAIIAKMGQDIFMGRRKGVVRIAELPFDPVRKKESVLVRLENGERLLVVRGAPETVIAPGDPRRPDALRFAEETGKKGRRTLAVATVAISDEHKVTIDPTDEARAAAVGVLSFEDPLKLSAKKAVRDAERLGVRVKIITGDAKEVAVWAGKEAGIIAPEEDAIVAADLLALPDDEQMAAVLKYDVFARTMPLEKHRIIELLTRQKIVGFLGEGFNDAPALKRAHVGLAVQGASDIAQDASDIILLNPSLHVIVDGIREGRKIFTNTTKYIRATLASNFGNFYALAFSSLFIPYLPMLPMQILLLNLLSDFPMIAIATDNVDEEELRRPKGYQVKEVVGVAVVLGVISTLFDFAFFGMFVGEGEGPLQTMWFMGSVVTELVLLFSIRTRRPFWGGGAPSRFITVLTFGVCALTVILPFVPWAREVFGFVQPDLRILGIAGGLAAGYFVSTEVMKILFYRFWEGKNTKAPA